MEQEKKKELNNMIIIMLAVVVIVLAIIFCTNANKIREIEKPTSEQTTEQIIEEQIKQAIKYYVQSYLISYDDNCKYAIAKITTVKINGNKAIVYGTYDYVDNYNKDKTGTFTGTYDIKIYDEEYVYIYNKENTQISKPR